ncbi:hypothetical protein B0H11DRAFT_1900054 [Mycena galericulata]|nr:hypothetical protein B0H11DRAFT_1900054 [Mycena galericulata]
MPRTENPAEMDIDNTVQRCQEELTLHPAPHPDRAMSLHNLANSIQERFSKHQDIDEVIELRREILTLCPGPHLEQARFLYNLGVSLSLRFNHYRDTADIDGAIEAYRVALTLLPTSHPKRAMCLGGLAYSLSARFEHRSNTEDLDEAIQLHREALTLGPPDKAMALHDVANLLTARFEHRGATIDIDEAMKLHHEALALHPDSQPNRVIILDKLAGSFIARFDHQGDEADLQHAVQLHREAVALCPEPDVNRAFYLNNLANSVAKLFRLYGNAADLDEAIHLLRESLALFPASHPQRTNPLNNLATYVLQRFSQCGDSADNEEAIQLYSEGLALLPASHPHRAMSLVNFSNAVFERFLQRGDTRDLDEVVRLRRQALALRPTLYSSSPLLFSSLANSLLARFAEQGDEEDIDEAIQLHRSALALFPAQHPDREASLNSLANSLLDRFCHRGDSTDIDAAIQLIREALSLRPTAHPGRAGSLDCLANALLARFQQRGDEADIDEAIQLHGDALALRPTPHPERASSLNNLANCLHDRYDRCKDSRDLDKTVRLLRDALDLCPVPHSSRALVLNGLANAVLARFQHKRGGDASDIDEAIKLPSREPRSSSPASSTSGHLSLFVPLPIQKGCFTLSNLASSLADSELPHTALPFFREALAYPSASPIGRFQAAKIWVYYSRKNHDTSTLEAYQVAISLMPQIATFSLNLKSRQAILVGQSRNLGSDAADCAIELGQSEMAIELLEAGRSVFWSQSLHLRTPLDDLRVSHPALANRLTELARKLEEKLFSHHKEMAKMEAEGANCRVLNDEWMKTVETVRLSVPGFEDFMQPKAISKLRLAAERGPVIILTSGQSSCHAVILNSDKVQCVRLPIIGHRIEVEFVAQMVQTLHYPAEALTWTGPNRLFGRLEETQSPQDKFGIILEVLWFTIVKPILRFLQIQKSDSLTRIWWCPTGPFTFLPVHAAGIYDQESLNECTADYDELLKIEDNVPAQWLTSFGTEKSPVSVDTVLPHLQKSSIIHFACHGIQDAGKPLESALSGVSHDGSGSQNVEKHMGLAFLSACQTATGDKNAPDEAIHLAATLLFAGFRSVVATMWTMQDPDGPEVAEIFYKHLFRKADPTSNPPIFPDLNESAEALHLAVQKLRMHVPFARWVPFVHYGLYELAGQDEVVKVQEDRQKAVEIVAPRHGIVLRGLSGPSGPLFQVATRIRSFLVL